MEERVSGGAIIQHISKLRQRLEAMGKNVPPPPRRGGGYGNSNSKGRNTSVGTPAAPRRTRAAANMRSNMKSNMKASETEEEEIDIEGVSGSEEEFGSGKSKVEKIDDMGIKQEGQSSAGNAGEKRKRERDSDSPIKRNKEPSARKPHQLKSRKTNHGATLSGSSGEDDDLGNESPGSDDDRYQQGSVGRQYLAAGADFFRDYDQDDASTAHASSCGESNVANRAVVLRFGESERAKAFLQHMQSQENAGRETDAESVASSRTTSIARFDGGRESIVHNGEVSSNTADVDYHSMSLRNSSHLSHEYNQQPRQVPSSNPSGSFVMNSNYGSIGLGNDGHLGGNTAIFNPSMISNPNFQASSEWGFQSMPADMVTVNFATPAGYSAHMRQQPVPRVFESLDIHPNSFMYQSSYVNNLGQEAGWSAPLAFDRSSAIIPRQGHVAPTGVPGSHNGTSPVLYENAFSRSQSSSHGCTQHVQASAVVNSASSDTAIQAPDFEIPEDINWTDFLDDIHGIDDVFNANLMTDIPNEGNGGTQAED